MPEVQVCPASDVPENGVISREVGDELVAIYNINGVYYATEARCTHGMADLADGILDDGTQRRQVRRRVLGVATTAGLRFVGQAVGPIPAEHAQRLAGVGRQRRPGRVDVGVEGDHGWPARCRAACSPARFRSSPSSGYSGLGSVGWQRQPSEPAA